MAGERDLCHGNIFRDSPMMEQEQGQRFWSVEHSWEIWVSPKFWIHPRPKKAEKIFPRLGLKYKTLPGWSFLAADVPPWFLMVINKRPCEIAAPAEPWQGYQRTDSSCSSSSQNSQGLRVKSQGSAQPLPCVAWIKSKIICEWHCCKAAPSIHLRAQLWA